MPALPIYLAEWPPSCSCLWSDTSPGRSMRESFSLRVFWPLLCDVLDFELQSGRCFVEFLVAAHRAGRGTWPHFCAFDHGYEGSHSPRKDGQRHQHLQPDAQYRRQRWHRDGGDHAGSQVAITHQHSGRTRQPGEPAGASNVDGMRGLFMSQGKDAATATRQAYGAVWGMVQ